MEPSIWQAMRPVFTRCFYSAIVFNVFLFIILESASTNFGADLPFFLVGLFFITYLIGGLFWLYFLIKFGLEVSRQFTNKGKRFLAFITSETFFIGVHLMPLFVIVGFNMLMEVL